MKRRKVRKARLERLFKATATMTNLAVKLGITPQTVSGWSDIPPEHCLAIEKITGISRHELRPDIYGPAKEQAVA